MSLLDSLSLSMCVCGGGETECLLVGVQVLIRSATDDFLIMHYLIFWQGFLLNLNLSRLFDWQALRTLLSLPHSPGTETYTSRPSILLWFWRPKIRTLSLFNNHFTHRTITRHLNWFVRHITVVFLCSCAFAKMILFAPNSPGIMQNSMHIFNGIF